MLWRESNFVLGEGLVTSKTSTSSNRLDELADWWQNLIDCADIEDQVGLPGCGLIAFASFTFSSNSAFASKLWIAKRTTVKRGELAWQIEIEQVENKSSSVAAAESNMQGPIFQAGEQDEDGFRRAVAAAVEKIRAGELSKVVLARDLVAKLPPNFSSQLALARLHGRYPTCWNYLIGDQLGASPELLLRAERNEISARVLAGTAARGTDPDVDMAIAEGLKTSHKNLEEHSFATESLVSQLAPISDAVMADTTPHSAALPDLWHLATDVSAKLKPGVSVLDVIKQIHPTAAVAGTPRGAAVQLIDQLEPFDRGGYAGPIGWLASDGSAEFALALRGGRLEPNGQIRAFAGGGIVAESDPESELAETELKFQAIRWAIGSQ
ncbi:MAG: hypothetical protein RL198_664 [Actinomycetota bacterium]